MPFLMQQKCLESETNRSGKLTQMFSELRSTLITSSDNGNANRMPWHDVVEPFSCCLLGREVLHRQQPLGQHRALKAPRGWGAVLGTEGFNSGFLESAECLQCVSHISWRCSCLSCCLSTGGAGVLCHFTKTTKPSYKHSSSISGTAWALLLPPRAGTARGGISSMGSHHSWGIG